MSTRWRRIKPHGLEIQHTNPPVVRLFGLPMMVGGLVLLVGVVGGLLRQANGPGFSWNALGMLAFTLGFVAIGAWALGYRGVRRLDVAADTYYEAGLVFGIGRRNQRRLSDFKRLIAVRRRPIGHKDTRADYFLFLFASRKDWTVLLTTYSAKENFELGEAVGKVLKLEVESLTGERWDELAS